LVDTKSWNELKDITQKKILDYLAAGRIGLLFMGVEKGDAIKKLDYLDIRSSREMILEETNIKITQNEPPEGLRKIRTNNFTSAAIRKYGLGSLGIMTIPETYRFILGDESTTYQNLWAKIFSELYISPSEDIVFKNAKWNWENEDLQINIYSRTDLDESGLLNSATEIPMKKTKEQTGMYSATVRSNPGWNNLSVNGNKNIHRFYTHSSNSWQAMKQSHLHQINQAAASQTRNIVKKENHKTEELPFYWGLLISLIGLGSLWLHERIFA